MLLKHPRTNQVANPPAHLIPRYLKGGWTPLHTPTAVPTERVFLTEPRPISETLAWVDGDPMRASTALRIELSRGTPRVTLVDQLRKLAAPNSPTGEGEEE